MRLPARTIFLPFKQSDPEALDLFRKWKSKKTDFEYNVRYQSFSTTTVSSNDVGKFKRSFNKYLGLFGKRLQFYEKNHYLLYQENLEETDIKNDFNLEHRTKHYLSAGLQKPTDIFPSGNEPDWSVYDEYWDIGSVNYVNPLAGNPEKRYFFKIEDTIHTIAGKIILIRFGPGLKKIAGRLRGFIFYNADHNAIHGLWAESAVETNSRMRITIETKNRNSREYSDKITYRRNLTRIQSYNTLLKLNFERRIDSIELVEEMAGQSFDEYIREYDFDFASADTSISKSDSLIQNTLDFYALNPQLKRIYNSFNFGREVSRGRIPLGTVDLETDKIINYNIVEGLRLGVGFITTEEASGAFRFEGYGGYGFGDQRFKYGTGLSYYFDRKYRHFIRAAGKNDVYESGRVVFEQQKEPMFGSESLRKYRISVMDNIISGELEMRNRIFKNTESRINYSYSELSPAYDYAFQGRNNPVYRYSQFGIGLKISPRQTKTRIGREEIVNQSPLPDVYFQWSYNGSDLGADYGFNKYEFRLNYQKQILGYGKSSLQVNYGLIDRSVPYHQLFVARGGLRNFSVVYHNTFETMRYNEFASDRYLAIFYSHNFGPLFIPFLDHFPSIEMLHNFGIGSLNNPEDHEGIDFQIMNRGFLESGIFVNDVVLLNASGLKTGIGAGFFYRYGSYQNPLFRDNVVFKFSVNLDL